MRPYIKWLLSVVLLLMAYAGAYTQKVADARYTDAIEEGRRIMDSLRIAGKIPGMDIAIAIDGHLVWSEGFGYADLEQHSPVISGVTRFRIGSVSKPLTAAAIGLLMDSGKLDVDQYIQQYVPEFPVKKYPVTVRQVGGHIAGIRHYRGEEFLNSRYYPTINGGLAIFSEDSLLFEPGTKYSYSSYGFNLLSAAVEGASGEEFLKFIQENVFLPLDMISTTADKNDSIISNRSSFYQLYKDNIVNAPYVDNSYKWAGGGFISTTHDLIKFGQTHMTPGFLSENTWTTLTSSQALKNGQETGYGIGWSVLADRETGAFGHSGGSVGGITQFRIYPKEELVIVILSNSSNVQYGNIVDRLVELFSRVEE